MEKFHIIITVPNVLEVEAETVEAAINKIKASMNPREANCATFVVAEEAKWDEESQTYVSPKYYEVIDLEEEKEGNKNAQE